MSYEIQKQQCFLTALILFYLICFYRKEVFMKMLKELYNKRWFPFFLLLTVPFIYLITYHIQYGSETIFTKQEWFYLEKGLEYLGITFAIAYLINPKHNHHKITWVWAISIILAIVRPFDTFADWLFFESPIADTWLKNFNPKDGDGIFMVVFIAMFLAYILKLIVSIIHRKVSFNSMFMTIKLLVLIILTTIFHIYAVQFNFINVRNDMWSNMERAMSYSKEELKVICAFENWACSYKDENKFDLLNELEPKVRDHYVEFFNSPNQVSKATIAVYDALIDDRHRYLHYSKDGIWLIDKGRMVKAFDEAEMVFLIFCAIGHFFWIYFTMILIILHKNRMFVWKSKNQKIESEQRKKVIEENINKKMNS